MLVCPNCNSKQESGKFCGVCGGTLESMENAGSTARENPTGTDANEQTAAAVTAQPQAQQTTEKIKNGVSQYGTYFLDLLKNPTTAFRTNENHFINGLITLILYAITFSLSLYFLANSLYKSLMGGFGDVAGAGSSIPFFALNSRLVFFIAILAAVSFAGALAMIKVAKNQENTKTLITNFGSLVVPFTAINTLAVLTGIAGTVKLTLILLGVSLILLTLFIPVLFVFEKATKVSQNDQNIYFSMATVLIIVIVDLFIVRSVMSGLLEDLENMIGMF
ncbi:hypothetical protein [Virgibacillus doumboii]|uniref:hypothetical protein n=1 Tax=Virgibacillus doumboii TaxID=2697503 RepID=UPI0013DF6385|nr:hypothetical protein [Virgibacillus doumboii]